LLNYILNLKDNNFILCIQGLYDLKTISYIESNIEKNINIIKNKNNNGLIVLCSFDVIYPIQKDFEINEKYNNIVSKNNGFLTFDVSINNKLVSIYNAELQSNINNVFNMNDLRKKQLNELILHISKLKKENKSSKLHIITGSLFMDKLKSEKLFDILKLINRNIITNTDTESRDEYILIYHECCNLDNVSNIIKYIYDNYKMKVIDINVREEMNFSKNLPYEIIFEIMDK